MSMTPLYLTFTPADESLTGIAAGLTGVGPFSAFTRSGPSDGLAHQLSFTSTADLHTITLTLTGTDADGQVITENLAAPTSNTVESTKYYKTLTSIAASATLGANTLDVGWVDEFVSPTIPMERYLRNGSFVGIQVQLSGTANFDIEETMNDLRQVPQVPQTSYYWQKDANFTGKSASLAKQLSVLAGAIRLLINSYSSGAVLKLSVITPR